MKQHLLKGISKKSGRNNLGRITSFTKGGGHKRKYRFIDFKRKILNGIILNIEYDPNRNVPIAFIKDLNTDHYGYILLTKTQQIGSIFSYKKKNLLFGDFSKLKYLPINSKISCIEEFKKKGFSYIRSAGTSGVLVNKDFKNKVLIKFPSGKFKFFSKDSLATFGENANSIKTFKKNKAGRSRWLGKRPVVRGVAMNPIDHPHGGGEGKTSGGRPSVSPWGKLTKGVKTRSKKKKNIEKLLKKSRI